jgi:hypothetical protein
MTRRVSQKVAVSVVYVAAMFITVMDSTIVNVALPWTSGAVLDSVFSGAALLAVLVVTELRTRQPLIDLRLLSNRLFRSCNGVMFLASAAFIGTLYIVTLFFQDGRGLFGARGRPEHVPRGRGRDGRPA